MRTASRRQLLAVALCLSLAGLGTAVGRSLTAQTTSVTPVILDNGLFPGNSSFQWMGGNAAAYRGGYFETTSNQTVSAKAYFTNMTPGATYDIYMTWVKHSGLSTAVPIHISGGPGIVTVDQTRSPVGIAADGSTWQKIGSGKPQNDPNSNVLVVDIGANRAHNGKIQLDGLMAVCKVNCGAPTQRTIATPLIIDSTAANWETEDFTTASSGTSYGGSHLQSLPGALGTASFVFMNLTPGAMYDIYVTYTTGTPGLVAGSVPGIVAGENTMQTGFSAYMPIHGHWPNGITVEDRAWQWLGSDRPYDNGGNHWIEVEIGGPEADGTYQVDAVMAICRNNCAPSSTAELAIIDDGGRVEEGEHGYFVGGSTRHTINAAAYDGDARECTDGNSVTYYFKNMDPGAMYDVYATWNAGADRSPAVVYSIGLRNASTVYVDQTQAPAGMAHEEHMWQKLGSVAPDTHTGENGFMVRGYCETGSAMFDAVMAVKTATPPTACGNGILEAEEQCDDGNAVDTDGCRNTCQIPRCGDGVTSLSEACDDGNADNTDGCTTLCKISRCGDGYRQESEQCDDGNQVDTDACRNNCTTPPAIVCGNGIVQAGEQCDDGNQTNTDGCTTLCKISRCGDGYRQESEQCDDGNQVDTDACRNNCTTPPAIVCGNGIVQAGEQCDDGNQVNADSCTNTCTLPTQSPRSQVIVDDDTNEQDATFSHANFLHARSYALGYNGDSAYFDAKPGSPTTFAQAQWKLRGLERGAYEIYVTWGVPQEYAHQYTTDAEFSLTSSALNSRDSVRVNQSVNPQSIVVDGRGWHYLGRMIVHDTEELIVFVRPGRQGYTLADAVLARRVSDSTTASQSSSIVPVSSSVRPAAPTCPVAVCAAPPAGCTYVADSTINPSTGCPQYLCGRLSCAASSTATPACGDGRVEGTEQCDDGNRRPGDGCSVACQREVCGDGIVTPSLGEQCDTKQTTQTSPPVGCSSACRFTYCGDGIVQAELRETCDDGNTTDTDACTNSCKGNVVADPACRQPIPVANRPWQNPVHTLDVDNNGLITAGDYMTIINSVMLNGWNLPKTSTNPPVYYDVDGNGMLEATDYIAITQYIGNRCPASPL